MKGVELMRLLGKLEGVFCYRIGLAMILNTLEYTENLILIILYLNIFARLEILKNFS